MAVNETELPWQKGLADAEMDILTGRLGLTVMVTELLVAGFPVAQSAFEVNSQVIISPLLGINEYVGLANPTLLPLTFQ